MVEFKRHTIDTAPEESKESMAQGQKNFGFIPGLHSVMAEAPTLYKTYNLAHEQFQKSSFNADELTVVWLAINVEHNCGYCVPAHTGIAKMMKVDDTIIDALRDETPLPSEKLEALRSFTLKMVRERGDVSDQDMQTFLDAGYTEQNILEIILGIAQKVMSNYVNHVAKTKTDDVFKDFAWAKAAAKAAE